jgi:UDP-N-acetylmuramyl pentapeptide phosphotransferase/UDP-N-acetylglucosamine-1-phosphate transferase
MGVERINSKTQWRIRVRERKIVLLIGDLVITYLSVFIALFTWAEKDWLDFSGAFLNQRTPFWFYLLPLGWVLLISELYDIRKANRRKDTLKVIAQSALIGLLIYLIFFFISEPNSLPRRGVPRYCRSYGDFSTFRYSQLLYSCAGCWLSAPVKPARPW